MYTEHCRPLPIQPSNMKWNKSKQKEDKFNIEVPTNWLQVHYYEALNVLFRTENALRIFVFIILKNEFADKWDEISISSDDETEGTIKSLAKRRHTQDQSFAYLGFPVSNPLMFLTSGELIRIITSEKNWKYFNRYFLGSKEIIKNKLDEIGNIRNSLAHFRPIREEDVDLIKQNAIHVFAKIEELIQEILDSPDVVPSNTEELWFKNLRTIGSEFCNVSFYQNKHEDWIQIVVYYNAPIISQTAEPGNKTFTTLKLRAGQILKEYPKLRKYITYLIEHTFHPKDAEKPDFRKYFGICISKNILSENHEEVKLELEKLLVQISNESELIKQDNLARGKLLEPLKVYSWKHDKSWSIASSFIDKFKDQIGENSIPEYWGQIDYAIANFISDTDSFPWMNTQITEEYELPF
jgi:hypothetical protein